MGILLRINGVTFIKPHIIDTVGIIPNCEHEYDNACDTECNICGATRNVVHNYDSDGYCVACGKRDPNRPWYITDYPVQGTLKGLYDLGSGEDGTNDSLVNHAPNPVATGTPSINGDTHTVSEDYITFSGESKYRMTPMLPAHKLENGIALIALFSTPNAGLNRPLISNKRASTGARACGMGFYSDRVEIAVEGAATAAVYNFDEPVRSNNFTILAFVGDKSGFRVLRYFNETLAPVPFDGGKEEYVGSVNGWDTNVFQIGGDGTGNVYNIPAHISLAAIHEGVVTDEQLTDICEFVKNYGEQKGLTVD